MASGLTGAASMSCAGRTEPNTQPTVVWMGVRGVTSYSMWSDKAEGSPPGAAQMHIFSASIPPTPIPNSQECMSSVGLCGWAPLLLLFVTRRALVHTPGNDGATVLEKASI